MNDDRLMRDIRALDRPIEVDPRFAARLFERLLDERRPRRRRGPILLLAATLLIGATLVGTVVVGGGAPQASEAPAVAELAETSPTASPSAERAVPTVAAPIRGTWDVPIPGDEVQLAYTVPADLDLTVTDGDGYIAFTAGHQPPLALDGKVVGLPAGAKGVKVSNVAGATSHYSGGRPVGTDAGTFMTGLTTALTLGVDLGPVSETRLGTTPALTADIRAASPDAHLDRDGVMFDIYPPSRIIVADGPGGAILLVQVWADTKDDLAAWLPEAERLIRSFDLVEAVGTEDSSSPTPGSP